MKTDTDSIKRVADYINSDFEYCFNIDCYTFLKLARDSFINSMRQTEEGRKYLKDAWQLTRTDMEVDKLRRKFGQNKEVVDNGYRYWSITRKY